MTTKFMKKMNVAISGRHQCSWADVPDGATLVPVINIPKVMLVRMIGHVPAKGTYITFRPEKDDTWRDIVMKEMADRNERGESPVVWE